MTNMATRHGFLNSVILYHILVVLYLFGPLNDVQTNPKGIGNVNNAINYRSTEYYSPNLLIFAAHGSNQHIQNPRRTTYLSSRVMRYPNSTSTFQLCRLQVSGDISPNPGPKKCNVCSRTLARNHRVIHCDQCKGRTHIKCGNIKPSEYKRIQKSTCSTWICPMCVSTTCLTDLPFYDFGNSTLEALFIEDNHTSLQEEFERSSPSDSTDNARLESLRRSTNNKELLVCHLNINSIQNKFEELAATINKISAHIVFVSETKIDASYPDEQFSIPGYVLYRKDRKKGGGGIMVLVSSLLPEKRLKLNQISITKHSNS